MEFWEWIVVIEPNVEAIIKAQAGDLAAWRSLLSDLYPLALRQARMLLRDRDLAEDAVQNAIIKIYLHLNSLIEPAAFSVWWRRILTNEVYLILRLNQRESQGLDEGILPQTGLAVDELVAMRCELARALQHLPLEQQYVVIDVDLRGASLQDAADFSRVSLGTVKSRLFRAREKLRYELDVFRQDRRGKETMSEPIGSRHISERFYDYLEGTMNEVERKRFETEFTEHPEWGAELQRHKDFVTLLHTLTGKLSLTAEEVMDKIQNVAATISDYEQIVDDTYFEQGSPQTVASHIWFRTPDQYRVESSHPLMGEAIVVVKDREAITYMVQSQQAVKIAVSEAFKEQMGLNFADALKKLAADKSSRLLGTEYVGGRPALHLQFNQKVSGKGDMVTHLWMDKETWMPLVTEWYNADGELVQRKVVRELRLNAGLPDERFTLILPPDVKLEDNTQQTVQPLQDITIEEARERLGQPPYLIKEIVQGEAYQVKHQWINLSSDGGVLLTHYSVTGEPLPKLTVTQGQLAHANLPPQLPTVQIQFIFAGEEAEGTYIELGLKPVKVMVVWSKDGRYYTAGGDFDRDGLLEAVSKLTV